MAGSWSGRSRRTRLSATAVAILVVLAPIVVGVAAAQQAPLEADNTVTRIHVRGDGDATWTIQIRIRLETDEQVAEFEAFRADFRRNTSRYLDPFRTRIRTTVRSAANATGRQMSAGNFTAETGVQEVPRRWGVVTFRFTWIGFAETTDETLVVGDVFRGGFFLAAGDSLEITAIEGYEVAAVEPTPDEREDGVLVWFGREDFTAEQPHVVFTPETPAAEAAAPTTSIAGPAAGGSLFPARAGQQPFLLGGVLLVGLVVGLFAFRRWGSGVIGGMRSNLQRATLARRTGMGPHGRTTAGGDILTDAERVEQSLQAQGGRMKQAEIADELGWSASKVSRLVSDMVEDGRVEKLQLGRENLVELVDDE